VVVEVSDPADASYPDGTTGRPGPPHPPVAGTQPRSGRGRAVHGTGVSLHRRGRRSTPTAPRSAHNAERSTDRPLSSAAIVQSATGQDCRVGASSPGGGAVPVADDEADVEQPLDPTPLPKREPPPGPREWSVHKLSPSGEHALEAVSSAETPPRDCRTQSSRSWFVIETRSARGEGLARRQMAGRRRRWLASLQAAPRAVTGS